MFTASHADVAEVTHAERKRTRSPRHRAEKLAWAVALPLLALVVGSVITYFPSSDDRAATARERQTTSFMKALDARSLATVGTALCNPAIPPDSILAQFLAHGLPAGGYHFYTEGLFPNGADEIYELNQRTPALKGIGVRLSSVSKGVWCVETVLRNPAGQYL